MEQKITLDSKSPTFADMFTQYISDIALEVEAIKLRNLKNDSESIDEHLARINRALSGIMDAKLSLAEKVVQSQSDKSHT
ncbi:MAG: hypothetical protein KGH76_02935 [Thaumarchaeota archaeon]|nr:hypothetical protein [Nitrososphaerota archaeon]